MLIEIQELELHPVDFETEFAPGVIDFGQDVRQLDRLVHAVQGLADAWKIAAADHLGADPFRERRQLLQRQRDGPA